MFHVVVGVGRRNCPPPATRIPPSWRSCWTEVPEPVPGKARLGTVSSCFALRPPSSARRALRMRSAPAILGVGASPGHRFTRAALRALESSRPSQWETDLVVGPTGSRPETWKFLRNRLGRLVSGAPQLLPCLSLHRRACLFLLLFLFPFSSARLAFSLFLSSLSCRLRFAVFAPTYNA